MAQSFYIVNNIIWIKILCKYAKLVVQGTPRDSKSLEPHPNSLQYPLIDVLWGQPIKLIQVVSTSEFHEY